MTWKNLIAAFISGMFLCLPSWAIQVVAEGEGITCGQALKKAQRNAIEEAVGVSIISKTKVKNFVLLEDRIVKYSKGLIKSFKVLSKESEGGLCKVQIEADISDNGIKDFFKDPVTQKFFQELCFNRRKIRVLYDPQRNPYAMADYSLPAQSLLKLLKGRLTDYMFEVTVETPHKRNPLKYNYDVLVYALVSKELKRFGYTNLLTVKVNLQAVDEVSGDVITTVEEKYQDFYNGNPSEAFIDGIVHRLGEKAVHKLVSKIVDNLSKRGCENIYYLIFENLPPEHLVDVMNLLDSLEDIKYDLKSQDETRTTFEVRTEGSLKDLLKELIVGSRKLPFRVYPKKISDTTIVWGVR